MLTINYDGSGQMGNKLLICLQIVAFAYNNEIKIIYYNFPSYEGICFDDTRIDKYIIKKKSGNLRNIFANMMLKICKRIRLSRIGDTLYINNKMDFLCNFEYIKMMSKSKALYWNGWPFLDYSSVRSSSNVLRNYFRFTEELDSRAKKFLCDYAEGNWVCAVHIRKGDYIKWLSGKFCFSDEEYIKIAIQINKFMELNNCKFILFSNESIDEEIWIKSGLSYVIPQRAPMEELCLMSQCHLIVGPPSTFSAWASFIGNVPRFVLQEAGMDFKLEAARVAYIETDGIGNLLEN